MNVTIDDEKLFEAFEDAIGERVINYWGYATIGYSEAVRRINEGKSFDVFDAEDDEKVATVTMETVENGFEVLINEYPNRFANIMSDNADFFDMDVLFQLCCFGEVVYG